MTQILVNYWTLQEQIRHNMLTESEATRHNIAQEQINRANVGVLSAQLQEQIRHNKVLEERVDYQNAADLMKSSSDALNATTKAYQSMASIGAGFAGGVAAGKFKGTVKPRITTQTLLTDGVKGASSGFLASMGAMASEAFAPMVLMPKQILDVWSKGMVVGPGQTQAKY